MKYLYFLINAQSGSLRSSRKKDAAIISGRVQGSWEVGKPHFHACNFSPMTPWSWVHCRNRSYNQRRICLNWTGMQLFLVPPTTLPYYRSGDSIHFSQTARLPLLAPPRLRTWLHNLYIPSLHDESAHPRIWKGMPTLTMLSCQLWSNVVPMLEAQYSNIELLYNIIRLLLIVVSDGTHRVVCSR